jgi:hypothetical protein
MATALVEYFEKEAVLAQNEFQARPESYLPRVFVYVRENSTWYELLKNGQATPWIESPEGRGFDFWIVDCDYLSDFGMYRADRSKRN